jgi:hypothetical protein
MQPYPFYFVQTYFILLSPDVETNTNHDVECGTYFSVLFYIVGSDRIENNEAHLRIR